MAFEFELPNPNTQNPQTNLGEGDLVRRSASAVSAAASATDAGGQTH